MARRLSIGPSRPSACREAAGVARADRAGGTLVRGADHAAGSAHGATFVCPESRFAIGIGAFGATDADCRDRYGEFVAVAGEAAYVPGDGTEVPDYLVASDAEAPELHALRGIACDGPFAHQFRFDVKPPAVAVTLDELAAAFPFHAFRKGRVELHAVVNVSPAWRALRSGRASAPRRPDCR